MIKDNRNAKCVGCYACEKACSKSCILLGEEIDGFSYPHIDKNKCIECHRCEKVCPLNLNMDERPIRQGYAGYSKNTVMRKVSSSGGCFYELILFCLNQGWIVYGAAFDSDFSVKHIRVDNIEDALSLMGSKYVQSSISDVYELIQMDIKNKKKVVFSGTPCQIAAVSAFFSEYQDDMYFISVICHGVPSPMVWNKYLRLKSGQYGGLPVKKVEFRNKKRGWNNFSICIDFGEYQYESLFYDDLYLKGFLQNLYLRESCYECRFKGGNVPADIIIGDFWGIENIKPDLESNNGISSILVLSDKGDRLVKSISDNMVLIPVGIEAIIQNNSALTDSVSINENRKLFFELLHNYGLLEEAMKSTIKSFKIEQSERLKYEFPVIKEYLKHVYRNGGLYTYVKNKFFNSVILYSITYIAEIIMYEFMEDSTIELRFADKNAQNYELGYLGYSVMDILQIKEYLKMNPDSCIIVCNLIREQEILDEFCKCGISRDSILTFGEVLYGR